MYGERRICNLIPGLKGLKKIPNWKAPGPDNVQGFWLRSIKKLHQRMALQLQECLDGRLIPEWMTKGRTVLLIKNKAKANAVGNYRPITCLPFTWKVLTGIIAEDLYQDLHQRERCSAVTLVRILESTSAQ